MHAGKRWRSFALQATAVLTRTNQSAHPHIHLYFFAADVLEDLIEPVEFVELVGLLVGELEVDLLDDAEDVGLLRVEAAAAFPETVDLVLEVEERLVEVGVVGRLVDVLRLVDEEAAEEEALEEEAMEEEVLEEEVM